MKYPFIHPFKSLKLFLPKTMFGRALLIIVAPLVFVQIISAYVFFDRHWDYVTKVLASNIAGEVATIVTLYESDPHESSFYRNLAHRNLAFSTVFFPQKIVSPNSSDHDEDRFLDRALEKKVINPYGFTLTDKEIIIQVQVEGGVLQFVTTRKRLYSKTTLLFVMWAAGTSIFFLLIAAFFMHNQVKPLRRLAIAADRFGKGRRFLEFKPEGAEEIRKVAQAFLNMRDRLHRQIKQRMDMLSGISHDLRTPLTRMRLQLAMLEKLPEAEGLLKDVDDMESMIEGYLAFVKGEGEESAKEVNLNELISEAIDSSKLKKVKVHFSSLKKNTQITLREQNMKRCLINLINNAQRYGHEVWVKVQKSSQNFTVQIEDNGPGIPEDKIAEVFKPFVRLEASRNVSTGGVGLGLSIARDIARSHGGDIVLSSSVHGGLCIKVILPK